MIENKCPLHPSFPFFRLIPPQTNDAGIPPGAARFGCLPFPGEKCCNSQKGIDDPKHGRGMIVISGVGGFKLVANVSEEKDNGYFELCLHEVFETIFVLGNPRLDAADHD